MSNESIIYTKNIKLLMTDIYNFLNYLSPAVMNDIFRKQENCYSLRDPKSLVSKRKFTTAYGLLLLMASILSFQRTSNLARPSSKH